MPDTHVPQIHVTAKDREGAQEIVNWFFKGERCPKHEHGVNLVTIADKMYECGIECLGSKIAHALASQREEDARVAENWIPDPHKEHEPCQDCATARGICDAIRRGGE